MFIFHTREMDFRCESVSFSVNANLENYFRKAIIHLTSPRVQFQNLDFSQSKLWKKKKYCISLIYCVLFPETITIWSKRGEEEEE